MLPEAAAGCVMERRTGVKNRLRMRCFIMLAFATGAGLAAPSDFIHAEGKRLVDGQGATFAIKGINLGNWLFPEAYMFQFNARAFTPRELAEGIERLIGREQAARFWTEFRDVYVGKDDIAFLKAAGFNTVRVPLSWRLFAETDDGGAVGFAGPGWSLLDRLTHWCREFGLRIVVDLHSAPGGQTGHTHDEGTGYPLTFYVPAYRRLTVALWQRLAARYRDETTILGYDLLNEPISPFADITYLNPRLEPLYRDIVAAIRGVDPNHAVLLGGAQWDTNFAVFGRPFDANTVYTYHKFWFDPNRAALQEYVNFSNRWNVPVVIGETGEYSDSWNAKAREINERFGIGWIFWSYKNLGSPLAVATIRKPSGWDVIVKAIESPTAPLPPRRQAQAILNAYLEAARFTNVQINGGYLHSLGLAVPATSGASGAGSAQ
jgi:aryl-phospho-beta-D-glucosidase BglC (GH1 family)